MSYNVLLFGSNLVYDIGHNLFNHPNATVTVIDFPDRFENLDKLSDYDLVIMTFNAFISGSTFYIEQERIFEKLMVDALNKGTNFCIVHYNEKLSTNLNENRKIFGYRILKQQGINTLYNSSVYNEGNILVNEFHDFFVKWGASHLCFESDTDSEVADIIYQTEDQSVLAICSMIKSSDFIFMPFQRSSLRKNDIIMGINKLIDSLLSYIVKKSTTLPSWADEPYFEDEEKYSVKILELEERINDLNSNISVFNEAKSLLFLREYSLENKLPQFLSKELKIETFRNEKFSEDFWILNDKSEKIIICEVKSMLKGFRKSGIYSLYNHREENNLPEKFPGIVFVNHHLQAGSWKTKDRSIDKQDYTTAFKNNILIVRIEDIVNLWDGFRKNIITRKSILELLMNTKGWLKVDRQLNISIFPKTA